MTTEEAKKAGFRKDKDGKLIVWNRGSNEQVRIPEAHQNLLVVGQHFPTRTEARVGKYWSGMLQVPPTALTETQSQEDARIKAKIDGYIAKGGPITEEQLTDEVVAYLDNDKYVRNFGYWSCYSLDGIYKPSLLNSAWKSWEILSKSLDDRPSFWNKADAEHAKWLADMQSQTTPITPEQGKNLCDYDTVYHPSPIEKPARVQPWPWGKDDACSKECLERGTLYFTRSAAQAALDKVKAEAEPLKKHGHKGMIHYNNNNTNKWEPDTSALDELAKQAQELHMGYETDKPCVESHETPVGETQGKEVVTDETQPTILEEAAKCVTGPRRRDYGTPDENFSLIASLWSVQLKHEVTPMQVAMCLILLKVARQANSPKRDNLVDIAGYAQCASELKGEK